MSSSPAMKSTPDLQTALSSPQGPSHNSSTHFAELNSSLPDDDPSEKIEAYLRCASKKAARVSVAREAAVADIKSAAQQQLGIARDKQLLRLNGQEITDYTRIRLQPRSIVHVAPRDALLQPSQTVQARVTILNAFEEKAAQSRYFGISGQQKVGMLIREIEREVAVGVESKESPVFYFLLQSSRLLDRQRTFSEQAVPENAELICLISKNELKTRFSNHTQDDILQDISALLQNDANDQDRKEKDTAMQENSKEVVSRREKQLEEGGGEYRRERRESMTSEQYREEEQFNAGRDDRVRNFKKKPHPDSTFPPQEKERRLLSRLKASKPKQQLEQLLKSQGKQDIFFREQAIEVKAVASKQEQSPQKRTAAIPKAMPVEQRRKIKQEMRKLFDGGSREVAATSRPAVQEQLPKSPPSQQPPPLEKRRQKMDKLRQSMGSRPPFLNAAKTSLRGEGS